MGILDDAIREHLELKRKHGVPEEEVERQEERRSVPPGARWRNSLRMPKSRQMPATTRRSSTARSAVPR